jgi:uncharacterized repeat protein (TIGR03803 family)
MPGATASIRQTIFSALRFCALGATAVLAPYSALNAQTATVTVLHSFAGPPGDGLAPISGLIQASDGNLYGTTPYGGSMNNNGVIYSITTSGQFAVVVDMVNPTNAPLLQASDGNFYGTTTGGHAGTVFEMPPGGALTTIHSFDVTDGRIPEAGLTEGSDGNLYGTTDESGTFSGTPDDGGTVFSITLGGGTFTLLHSFSGTDGQNPLSAGLVEGSDGYFYGTTESSTPGEGTVFKVFPTGEFQSLHTFTGTDGGDPVGGLLLASDDNFYGTTEGGGVPPPTGSQSGTVFKMTPDGTLTTLYTFTGLADGGTPECNLVEGKDGNFYGTTSTGAISNNGTVFVITPAGVLTTLHQFAGYPTDGGSPQNGLLLASDGNFYGTTHYGGANNMGTVFQMIVTPAPSPAVTSATVDSGTVGAPFTYQITATNGPTSFGASGLPAGLSVAANGLISGVPTQPGTFAVTLSASNGRGTGSALLQLINHRHPCHIAGGDPGGHRARSHRGQRKARRDQDKAFQRPNQACARPFRH